MTTPTNWPNPERPGVPMFPDRGGWHILIDGGRCACYWNPDKSLWWNESKRVYISLYDIARKTSRIEYIGPCFTPAQIAEMLAAERERCANACEDAYEKSGRDFEYLGCNDAAVQIRTLGDAP